MRCDCQLPIIAPSLLAANAGHFSASVAEVEQAGAEYLHIDVMDGHFVPNLSFGPNVVAGIRSGSQMYFDVHLMIERPVQFAEAFINAGADCLTFHPEAGEDLAELLSICQVHNVGFGIALKPETDISSIKTFLPYCKILLVMSIQPGFGGQTFMPSALERIREAFGIRSEIGAEYLISVDGGVNTTISSECISAGADILVAGSAIYGAANPSSAVRALKGCVN